MILKTKPHEMFGHEVRRGKLYGKMWFVAKDLCEALDIQIQSNELPHKTALSCLDVDECAYFQIKTEDEIDEDYCISQSGVIKLIMRSDIAEAKEFQNWLALDVIPALGNNRKYVLSKYNAYFRRHR